MFLIIIFMFIIMFIKIVITAKQLNYLIIFVSYFMEQHLNVIIINLYYYKNQNLIDRLIMIVEKIIDFELSFTMKDKYQNQKIN